MSDELLAEVGNMKARITRLNVVDEDGDMILPGAVDEHEVPVTATDFNPVFPPAGMAKIKEEGDAIVADIEFDDTPTGKAEYRRACEHGDAQQWTISFRVLSEYTGNNGTRTLDKIEVLSVSPTMDSTCVDSATLS